MSHLLAQSNKLLTDLDILDVAQPVVALALKGYRHRVWEGVVLSAISLYVYMFTYCSQLDAKSVLSPGLFVDTCQVICIVTDISFSRLLKQVSNIILLVRVHDEAESLSKSPFPVLVLLLELVDVGLVADLSPHSLLSEDLTDRSPEPVSHSSNLRPSEETERYEDRRVELVSNVDRMIE